MTLRDVLRDLLSFDLGVVEGEELAELARRLGLVPATELEATRAAARQLRAALADLTPRHISWCMGHEGGIQTTPDGTRVGIGPLVVKACRCPEAVQRAREALQASAHVVER
jgi:hypothetical protein